MLFPCCSLSSIPYSLCSSVISTILHICLSGQSKTSPLVIDSYSWKGPVWMHSCIWVIPTDTTWDVIIYTQREPPASACRWKWVPWWWCCLYMLSKLITSYLMSVLLFHSFTLLSSSTLNGAFEYALVVIYPLLYPYRFSQSHSPMTHQLVS